MPVNWTHNESYGTCEARLTGAAELVDIVDTDCVVKTRIAGTFIVI